MVQPPYDQPAHPAPPHAVPQQPYHPGHYPPPPQQPYPQPHGYPAAPPRPKSSSNKVGLTIGLVIGGLFLLNIFWTMATMAWSALTVDTRELVPRSETLVRACAGAGDPIECSIAAGTQGQGVFTKEFSDRIAHWEAKHGALAAVDTARGCQDTQGMGHMAVVVVTATFGTQEQVLHISWLRIPDTDAWTAMTIAPVASLAGACG